VKTKPRVGPETFESFCDRVREDQKADLLDGVIYMASPENLDANDLCGWLYTLLRMYVRRLKLGRVFFSRVAMRLDEENVPEPDILFVRAEREEFLERGGLMGAADLAIEVVSPESVERDYGLKREKYESHGVQEYWIVDEFEQRVTLLRLNKKGKYREVRPKKGELHSEVVPGFWIRTEWLWRYPLSDGLDELLLLLGESD
jgi:Uma2 family endonuclease